MPSPDRSPGRPDEPTPGPPRAADVLVGRDAELAALDRGLAGAVAGEGGLVWLLGEGGIGKTTIADATIAAARRRGMAVFAASADELEQHRPFGVLADALAIADPDDPDPRRASVARLLAPDRDPGIAADGAVLRGGGELAFAIAEAILVLLEDRCVHTPALLVLEDLHWADLQSLELVGRLARRATTMPLLVLATARVAPAREEVDRAVALSVERGAERRSLAPLDASEAEALAARLTGGTPDVHLRACVAACGGNPLFVSVLVEGLEAEQAIERRADGRVEAADRSVPASLAATVLGRLRALPSDAVETVRLASVLGGEFAVTDLALLAGRPAAELAAPLREALAAGTLVERGDRLGFAHDVVREALYDDLPRSVRVGLHRDLGQALAAAGRDALTVAEHLVRGARPGDRDAVTWLERAASEAAARSAGVAAELLSAALDLVLPGDPDRGRLEAELALRLLAAGRRLPGEELARRVLDGGAHPPADGALQLALARSLIDRGALPDALVELGRAAEQPDGAAADRAEALAWLTIEPLFAHDLDRAEGVARRALAVAEESGAAHVLALSLTRLSHVVGLRGDFAQQQRLTARAVAVTMADGGRDPHHVSHAHMNHAMALAEVDRAEEGIAAIAAGRREYERLGLEETLRNTHHYASYPLMVAGRWDDAVADLETAATLSAESGLAWVVDVLASQAVILTRQDELEPARAVVAAAEDALAAGAPEFRVGWTAWGRALVEESDGRPELARETLWAAWERAEAAGAWAEQRWFALDLARLLADAGDAERGDRVAARMLQLAAFVDAPPTVAALALRCRALVAGDIEQLVAAAEAYPPDPRPHERALAYEDAAVACAAAGDLDRARTLSDEALAVYERLGARRDAARTAGRLRQHGLRRGQRGSRQRPATGWAALTPSERRVAELAAEGLSNPRIAERLVISRHTVATHVSRALAKLELRSRHELAGVRPSA